MSYLAAAAIIARIREVLQESAGDSRTVPSGRFFGDIPTGLAEQTLRARALVRPRVEVTIPRAVRHPQSPLSNGSILLYAIDVEVRVVRVLPSRVAALTDVQTDAVRALAIEDADVIRQAFEVGRNLATTSAGVSTGLLSGALRYADSSVRISSNESEAAPLIETIHAFTGAAKATSEAS